MGTQIIREVVDGMPEGQIFATRDMLKYGSRNAVDMTLYRLNASKVITRLTYGLYMKGGPTVLKPPIEEIARLKARAFHRNVVIVSADLAEKLDLPFENEAVGVFATNGRTASIKTCHGTVGFIGGSVRKIIMGDSPVAIALRNAWLLGKRDKKEWLQKAITEWTSQQWDECDARVKQLPQWLSEWLLLPLNRSGAARFQII